MDRTVPATNRFHPNHPPEVNIEVLISHAYRSNRAAITPKLREGGLTFRPLRSEPSWMFAHLYLREPNRLTSRDIHFLQEALSALITEPYQFAGFSAYNVTDLPWHLTRPLPRVPPLSILPGATELEARLDRVCAEAVERAVPAPRGESDDADQVGLNNCFFKTETTITHDELRFRSPAEVAVYDELKQRKMLFFPNAAAVLGARERNDKREPDFLVCQAGRWGVLEVMGATYHDRGTAVKDHERARLFKEHGLLCVEFYPAARCLAEAAAVVDDFLALLARHPR